MNRAIAVAGLLLAIGAAPAHSQSIVKLAWSASSSAAGNPTLTYNVYRASTCNGHFSQLNSAPVTTTSYSDSTIAVGAVYCYEVTAMLSGEESTPSNQTVAAVPPPSNRSATCAHRGPVIGWIRCVAGRAKKVG